jgi:hypothetical protein
LSGITVSFHPFSSDFIVNFKSKPILIEDFDNFGETVQFNSPQGIVIETLYFEPFLSAIIFIIDSQS